MRHDMLLGATAGEHLRVDVDAVAYFDTALSVCVCVRARVCVRAPHIMNAFVLMQTGSC